MTKGNIGKIKASRVNGVPNVESYIGEKGILFFNFANGVIRLSDGVTPGGVPIPYNIASNTTVGGIKAGPGTVISNDGELFINTAGLPLSFGDFTANSNILTVVNNNEDMVLVTSGEAEIQLVGNIGFYRPDGLPPNSNERYFYATNDGQVRITVPATDPLFGAVEIIGSTSGNIIAPGTAGTMLHLTGQLSIPTRLYMDGNNEYVSLVGRRWNGNVNNPTQVLAGQDIIRINSTAATNLGVGNVSMAQIRTTAIENQTSTAQGSSITFTVTPVGSPASARVDVANITVADGVTATKFTTSGTVSASSVIGTLQTAIQPNITQVGTLTSLSVTGNINVGANSKIIAPGITINDGGIRSLGSTNAVTIDFSIDTLVHFVQSNNTTITLSNYTAGRSVRVIMQVGATAYTLNTGLAGVQNSTTGATTFAVGGGAGINPNQCVVIDYTCIAGNAATTFGCITYK